jgi:hypothetical protein
MSTQVVASQDSSLLQNNHTLQAKNAHLEGQIEDLIKERDQAKRWNERLRAKLDNARKGRRRSQLIIEGVRECKPRALWTDVLLPMVSSNIVYRRTDVITYHLSPNLTWFFLSVPQARASGRCPGYDASRHPAPITSLLGHGRC